MKNDKDTSGSIEVIIRGYKYGPESDSYIQKFHDLYILELELRIKELCFNLSLHQTLL